MVVALYAYGLLVGKAECDMLLRGPSWCIAVLSALTVAHGSCSGLRAAALKSKVDGAFLLFPPVPEITSLEINGVQRVALHLGPTATGFDPTCREALQGYWALNPKP